MRPLQQAGGIDRLDLPSSGSTRDPDGAIIPFERTQRPRQRVWGSMTLQQPVCSSMERPSGRGPIRRLIGELDEHLSRTQGVKLFSADEACLLRYAAIPSPHRVRLSDGTEVRPGDLVVDIHCWNDRVPLMARTGPNIAWAQDTSRRFRRSLRLLAEALATDPELRAAKACRAQVNFVGQGGSNASVSRIIQRMGFEDVDEGGTTLWTRVHRQFENLLIAALVWTHNPDALRRNKMIRERRPVWASRAQVIKVHGRPAPAEGATSQAA